MVRADDSWPQFRGPDGQGHTDATALPLRWSESENVWWKLAVPGEGWSSPVISGNRVWMTNATEEGKSLRVLGVDLSNGKLLIDRELFHPDQPVYKHEMNSYASPSPIVEKGWVYVSFGACGTACCSTETGAVRWKREDLKIDHKAGPGSSPALYRDRLIIPFDGTDSQFVVALDKRTGETAWKTDRAFLNGKKPVESQSFCTPLIAKVGGADQVLIPGAQRTFAYDPATGKELWWVTYDGWSIVPRPLFGNDLFYVTTGYSSTASAIMAIRPGGHGDVTQENVVWKVTNKVPMIPSLVLVGRRLFGVHDTTGTVFCLDAMTGSDIWREKIGGQFSASLLAAPGRIYLFDRRGATTVVASADKYKILAKNKLDSGCMASAAVAGKALIVRTKTHLYRIEQR